MLKMRFSNSTANPSWATSLEFLPAVLADSARTNILHFALYSIVVEFAKESRPRREPYDDHDRDR